MSSAFRSGGFRLHLHEDIQSDGRARKWIKGLRNTFRFSLAARRPALFNPSSPNTESLNQGPAVFSTRLMYRRKSGWSAKPPGTGAHLASGNHWVIVSAVLLSDWTNPTIGIEIKELPSGGRRNTISKSQNLRNTVTERAA